MVRGRVWVNGNIKEEPGPLALYPQSPGPMTTGRTGG
jgi:hypothetical protein